MPRKKEQSPPTTGRGDELLRDILITQLGLAGVPQATIRDIVGCDIRRVNEIVRHLKPTKKR